MIDVTGDNKTEIAWRTAENIATERTGSGVEEVPTWGPEDGCDGYCFPMLSFEDRFVEVVLEDGDVLRVGIWEGDVDEPELIATPVRTNVDPV